MITWFMCVRMCVQCMVYMGTLVSAGHGRGVVVGTGMHCELGRVFEMISEQEERRSPLQV